MVDASREWDKMHSYCKIWSTGQSRSILFSLFFSFSLVILLYVVTHAPHDDFSYRGGYEPMDGDVILSVGPLWHGFRHLGSSLHLSQELLLTKTSSLSQSRSGTSWNGGTRNKAAFCFLLFCVWKCWKEFSVIWLCVLLFAFILICLV